MHKLKSKSNYLLIKLQTVFLCLPVLLLVACGGGGSSSSGDSDNAGIDGNLLFFANDGVHGNELWASDGSKEGTALVKDIFPGDASFDSLSLSLLPNAQNDLAEMIYFNGRGYFKATDGISGYELWSSDGTFEGTRLVKDINTGIRAKGNGSPTNFTHYNNLLYFYAYDETGNGIWQTDGTTEGTRLVKYTGTVATPGSDAFTVFGDKMYFSVYGNIVRELWVSDGTEAGTVPVRDVITNFPDSSNRFNLTVFDGALYFSATGVGNGEELWKSDGLPGGTTEMVLKINEPGGGDGSYPRGLTVFNGALYFSANNGVNGIELWVSDGTAEGTRLVKDINTTTQPNGDPRGSDPRGFFGFNNNLYFSADNSVNGRELWISDGLAGGSTQMLFDINPVLDDDSFPGNFVSLNNALYFTANDGTNGFELWMSDGQIGGNTSRLLSNPGDPDLDRPSYLNVYNNMLFFAAEDITLGFEAWVSDGSAAGTSLLKDINPGIGNGIMSDLR